MEVFYSHADYFGDFNVYPGEGKLMSTHIIRGLEYHTVFNFLDY